MLRCFSWIYYTTTHLKLTFFSCKFTYVEEFLKLFLPSTKLRLYTKL